MAIRSWDEVAASPEFQALELGDKKAARDQYFLDVLSPKVSEAEHPELWRQFNNYSALPEEAGYGEVITKGVENFPERNAGIIANAGRAIVETGDPYNYATRIEKQQDAAASLENERQKIANEPSVSLSDDLLRGIEYADTYRKDAANTLSNSFDALKFLGASVPSKIARNLWEDPAKTLGTIDEEANAQIGENSPAIDYKLSPKSIVSTVATSGPDMLPGLAMSLITKDPRYMMAYGGATSAGQAYGEQRRGGSDPYTAATAATGYGIAEALGEKIPLDHLFRTDVGTAMKIGGTIIKDSFGEGVTQVIQSGIDKGTIHPDMTLGDALEDTMVAMGAGGLTAGIYAPAYTAFENWGKSRRESNQLPPSSPPAPPQLPPAAPAAPAGAPVAPPANSDAGFSVNEMLPDETKQLLALLGMEEPAPSSPQSAADGELEELLATDTPVEQIVEKYSAPAAPPAPAPTTSMPALPPAPPEVAAAPAAELGQLEPAAPGIIGDGSRIAPIRAENDDHVLLAGAQAASSPFNELTEPSEAQKEAGNYKKGHVNIQGLNIAIESPRGGTRSGTEPDGTPWSVQMKTDYGYIKRSEGADGDHVDTFLGPNPQSDSVTIIDQVDPETGKFDEHKVMIGFDSPQQAESAYRGAYDDNGQARIGASTTMTVKQFKEWLKNEDTKKPAGKLAPRRIRSLGEMMEDRLPDKASAAAKMAELERRHDAPGATPEQKAALTAEMDGLAEAARQEIERPASAGKASIYEPIEKKIKGMPRTQQERRFKSLNTKLAAGVAPTTAEMYERDALSEILAPAGNIPARTQDIPVRAQSTQNAGETTDMIPSGNKAPAGIPSFRPGKEDTALTPRRNKVAVRYGLVEADELTPSQTDDMRVNPNFPQVLQPRDRSRFASEQQIQSIAQNIEPRLLMESPQSSEGAPIINDEGIVESGNGRILALRRAYKSNPESAARYKAALAEAGYPVDGMKNPVLVRMRTEPMDDAQRVQFTKESNERTTAAMSSTEQAFADARALDDSVLELYQQGDIALGMNRAFVRAFVRDAIPQSEQAAAFTKDGGMSSDLVRRLNAAMLAKAYGDESIVQSITELTEDELKSLATGLVEAAPLWAKMRAAAKEGAIAPKMDTTANLVEAVKTILEARRAGTKLADKLNQNDIFAGGMLPLTEAYVRIFHLNPQLTRLMRRERIAELLNFYSQEALKSTPGTDMLGEEAPPPKAVLETARQKVKGDEIPTDERQGSLLQRDNAGRGPSQDSGGEREVAPESRREEGTVTPGASSEKPAQEVETPSLERTEGEAHVERQPAGESAVPAEAEGGEGVSVSDTESGKEEISNTPAKDKAPVKLEGVMELSEFAGIEQQLLAGELTAADLAALFRRAVASSEALIAELQQKTKAELIRIAGGRASSSDKKDSLVKSAYSSLIDTFHVGESMSWSPFTEKREEALERAISKQTDEDVKKFVERHAARAADRKQTLTDPQTLSQFYIFIRMRGMDKLTVEQKRRYEELVAASAVKDVEREKEKKNTVSAVKLDDVEMELVETKHTKSGQPLYVVKLSERVGTDKYRELVAKAKRLGGWYSRYAKDGAVPGFQFKTKENADKFMSLKEGSVQRQSEAEIDAKEDATADRLIVMADRLQAAGEAKMNAERKVNTHRRASMAASAEADAAADIAIARTMRNLAEAIKAGSTKYLQLIKHKTDIETLEALAKRAVYNTDRNLDTREQQSRKGRAPTEEDIDAAEYPYPFIHVWNFDKLIEKAKNTNMQGVARLSARVKKILGTRTEYYQPKDATDIATLWEFLGALKDRGLPDAKWEMDRFDDYNRLQRMGITSPQAMRAILREFLQYRGATAKADPVKVAERELVGKKFDGYFPTPPALAERMAEEAGIESGMSVLEPSAGKGSLADAAAAHTAQKNIDTYEIVSDLRRLLELKGYTPAGSNFMEAPMKTYDRVLMNPPFENGQDVEHVQRAYDFLAPGGRMVAIMSEGPFFRQDKKSSYFRDWLQQLGGTSEKLPERTFMASDRATGVNTRLVVIDKPAGEPDTMFQAAFHGSPHRFDKFTLDHIGTGEGAQAYGWGLYFAGARQVAEFYREKLSQGHYPTFEELKAYFKPGRLVDGYAGKDRVISFNTAAENPEMFPAALRKDPHEWTVTVQRVVQKDGEWVDSPNERQRTHHTAPSSKDIDKVLGKKARGQLYAVDIPEDDVLLDWDKPLDSQPQKVKEAISPLLEGRLKELKDPTTGKIIRMYNLPSRMIGGSTQDATGQTLYNFLKEQNTKTGDEAAMPPDEAASRQLLSIGISGIKYLDGASRDKGTGNHNYVIFDDGAINVLETYYLRDSGRLVDASNFQVGAGYLYQPMTEWTSKQQRVAEKLGKIAKEKFGDDFNLKFYNAMVDMAGNPVSGTYVTERNSDGSARARFAAVVLGDGNPNVANALHHEGIHFLYKIGAFGDKWATLRHQAKVRWRKEHNILERYEESFRAYRKPNGEALTEDQIQQLLDEEAIAEAYAAYEDRGIFRQVWDKISDFIAQVRRALNDEGFHRWQDIFGDVSRGEYRAAGNRDVWQGDEFTEAAYKRPELIKALLDNDIVRPAADTIKSAAKSAKTVLDSLTRSNDHNLYLIQKAFKSKTVERIREMVWTQTGDDKVVSRTYDEAVQTQTGAFLNRLGDIFEKVNARDRAEVTRLVQNPNAKSPNKENLKRAVELTKLLADHRKYLRDRGIPIKDMEGYFPREWQADKVAADQAGFLKAAEEVYYITYKDEFEKEILEERAKKPALKGQVLAAGEMERLIRSRCKEMARHWLANMMLRDQDINPGDTGLFASSGMPTPNNLKARVLAKEADELLRPYLVQDPVQAVTPMLIRTIRRAEFEERFGPEKWAKIRDGLIEDGLNQDAIEHVKLLVRSSTYNMSTSGGPKKLRNAIMTMRTWAWVAYLSRVVWSSISEPFITAIRTRRVSDGLIALVDTISQVKRRQGLQEFREIAEDILGITGEAAESLQINYRMGSLDAKLPSKLGDRFFRATLLTQYTDWSRVAVTKAGVRYLQRLSADLLNPNSKHQKASAYDLRQLGIPENRQKDFAEFVVNGGLKPDKLIQDQRIGEMASHQEMATTALRRFVEQIIMSPKASERQVFAQHPVGSLLYALQAYMMAFSKNVLIREMKLAREAFARGKGYTWQDRRQIFPSVMAHALYLALVALLDEVRDEILFSRPNKKPLTLGERLFRIISRGGYTGGADPYIHIIQAVKYRKAPSEGLIGPSFGIPQELVVATAGLVYNNSPNTNTAERRAADSYYKLVLAPAVNSVAAMKLPVWASYPIIQTVSSPQAQEAFTTAVAGKKQER